MSEKKRARVIAYYLPQFHPVPENDKFWGKGFTEWTNVAKAKPLFRGHEQPRIPADLGFYDLRLSEVREAQAELAKEAGIEGFCYWHYWFGNGKQVLEMPFNKVVESGKPDFPFCLGWANHDWTTKTWDKGKGVSKDTTIFKQEYPGIEDIKNHFYTLLPAFKDHRYIKVEGRLLFSIYEAHAMPDVELFIKTWNELAKENGLKGFYFVALSIALPKIDAQNINDLDGYIEKRFAEYLKMGFDGVNSINLKYAELKAGNPLKKAINGLARRIAPGAVVEKYDYKKIMENFYTKEDQLNYVYPQLIPGWDRSPRSGRKAIVYYNSTPENFEMAAENAIKCVENRDDEHRLIFLNSWNEWGEGAYMEPDQRYGKAFIETLRKVLTK